MERMGRGGVEGQRDPQMHATLPTAHAFRRHPVLVELYFPQHLAECFYPSLLIM